MNDIFDNQQPGQQNPQYQPYSNTNADSYDYRPDGNNANVQNNAWQTGYQAPSQPYNSQPYNSQPYNSQPYNSQPYNSQPYNSQPFNLPFPQHGYTQQNIPQQPYGYQPVPLYDPAGKAVTGFVLGLVGIIAWLLPLAGYPVTIVGLVMSYRGMKSSKRPLAIAGMVLCIIFLIATVFSSIIGITNRLK